MIKLKIWVFAKSSKPLKNLIDSKLLNTWNLYETKEYQFKKNMQAAPQLKTIKLNHFAHKAEIKSNS